MVQKTLNALAKHGPGELQTFEAYQQEMRWMRMGEFSALTNPFPPFFRKNMYNLHQQNTLPDRFWSQLTNEYIGTFDIEEEDHTEARFKVVSDRLMAMFETENLHEAEPEIVELFEAYSKANYLFIHLFMYACVYLFISSFDYFTMYVFSYVFICLFMYVFIYLCMYVFIYLFIMYVFIYLFMYVFIYLCMCLSIYLFICVCVY